MKNALVIAMIMAISGPAAATWGGNGSNNAYGGDGGKGGIGFGGAGGYAKQQQGQSLRTRVVNKTGPVTASNGPVTAGGGSGYGYGSGTAAAQGGSTGPINIDNSNDIPAVTAHIGNAVTYPGFPTAKNQKPRGFNLGGWAAFNYSSDYHLGEGVDLTMHPDPEIRVEAKKLVLKELRERNGTKGRGTTQRSRATAASGSISTRENGLQMTAGN